MSRAVAVILGAALAAGAAAWAAGCASAPSQRPIKAGSVDAGPGSLEAARRQLEGTWQLVSLDVIDAAGAKQRVGAKGRLTYDAYGNMDIRGVIEDERIKNTIVLDFTGRVVIDPARKVFYPADLTNNRPDDPADKLPIANDKARQFEVTGDTLRVTYPNAEGKPVAIAMWKKQAAE